MTGAADGNGHRTEYAYDANRRLKRVLFQDGTAYDFDYDARGNRTLERSPTHERGLAYDALGRLERVEDRTLGRVITYGYDAAGRRTRMEIDSGEVVSYRWDMVGRLLEVLDPQGQTTRFSYDAAGRRTGAAYGNGTRATYSYDPAGQVRSIAYFDRLGDVQTAFGYDYDASGNRTHKQFTDGTKEGYGYDALNRLVSVDYPDGRHVGYGYDAVGNRREMVDTAKATVTRWGASARASTEQRTSGAGSAGAATGAPDVNGCATGTLLAHWWPQSEGSAPAREEWLEVTYATAERAVGLKVHETALESFVTRVELVDEAGQGHTVYEGGDQTSCGSWLTVGFPLTSYKVKSARVYTRAAGFEGIDAVGLEVPRTETYTYNGFNQLLSMTGNDGSSTAFGYDGNGNQRTKTDASGTTTYVYDDDNRLVGISLPGGGSNAFEYDATGLRVKKTDSGGTTRYLLDGLSVIAQYAPDGARQAWYTQSLARIDEVLSVVNDSGKQWYQQDALGSVYALTNASGDLVGSQGYDVFGAPTPAPSGPAGQPFGFTGREHELDSGLVYARNRFLNPSTGTWTRPDPLGLVAGVNYYVYSARGVTSASDPLGLFLVTRSTMEAYAIAHFEAWVSLMVDLGLINLIREANKNEINVQTDCPPGEDKDKGPITYYRGLSVADAQELAFMGEISSKMRRSGADLEQGYEAHMGGTAARQHLYTSRGSPYVSVTLSQDVARRFALGSGKPPKDPDDAPSGVVVSVITKRPPARPGVPEDLEYLFFWMIGQPTDQIVPVEWH